MKKYVVPVAVRFAALLATWAVPLVLMELLPSSGDANIGLGVLVFAMVMGVAGIGGLLDGIRWSILRVAGVWLASGLLLGLVVPWLTVLSDGGDFDPAVVRADIAGTVPFVLVLVLLPAVAGGVLGRLVRPAPRSV